MSQFGFLEWSLMCAAWYAVAYVGCQVFFAAAPGFENAPGAKFILWAASPLPPFCVVIGVCAVLAALSDVLVVCEKIGRRMFK